MIEEVTMAPQLAEHLGSRMSHLKAGGAEISMLRTVISEENVEAKQRGTS